MEPESMTCDTCDYCRCVQLWGKREESGEWYQYDGYRCFHPQARNHAKPDNSGGVRVGNVCWICRGYWLTTGYNE